MKEYLVSIPITGVAVMTVQAESEAEAIAVAIDNVTLDKVEDWAPVEKIVGGNIFYGIQNEADVEEQ